MNRSRKAAGLVLLPALMTAALVVAACSSTSGQGRGGAASADPPDSDADQLAYGVGFYLGEEVREGLRDDGVQADLDLIVSGFVDGLREHAPLVARDDLDEVLRAVHVEMQQRMVERRLAEDPAFRRLYEQNLDRSRTFHERYAAEPGVVTLPTGEQYQVLATGQGRTPGPDDVVLVTYTGERLDGTVFDTAERRRLVVEDTLPGTQTLLQQMRVGDRWKVAIPPDRAFGAGGMPPLIGPNETLTAEVELVGILGPEEEG